MKLYSNILGKGEPLLILHGLYGSSDNWLSIAKVLAKNFSVHCLDLRNHGRSPHSDQHTYKAMAKDVREYVELHQLEKIYLVGHSMGGKVAMLFTLNYPELVKKLIVADIAPKNYHENDEGHRQILAAMSGINLANLQNRKEVEDKIDALLNNQRVTLLVTKNLYRTKDKHFAWRINVPILQQQLDNITKGIENWEKKYSDIPTLFIKGENSHYLGLGDDFVIKKYFSNSEIATIPNAGHWVHAEQPELVIKTILYFIK